MADHSAHHTQMNDFWQRILGPEMPPHGHCYLWNDSLVWLHVTSDTLISLSYFTIPLALIYLVRNRDDLKFNYIFVMFALFIFACGATHAINILNVWYGAYWLSGTIKAITALASVGTAILVWPLIPKALALPSTSQLWELNEKLQAEVAEKERKQAEVEKLSADLRALVDQRTTELAEARLTKTLLEKANTMLTQSNQALADVSRASTEGFIEPLRVINVYSRRLAEREPDNLRAEQREWLEKICQASDSVSLLNAGLLRYCQLPLTETEESTNVSELVDSLRTKLQDELVANGASLHCGPITEAPLPPKVMDYVLTELIGNALRFHGAAPPHIEIADLPANEGHGLSVRDNGRGIPCSRQRRVFGLFEQFDSPGQGVGLAAVKRLLEEYGAEISLRSDGETGSEFRILYPG